MANARGPADRFRPAREFPAACRRTRCRRRRPHRALHHARSVMRSWARGHSAQSMPVTSSLCGPSVGKVPNASIGASSAAGAASSRSTLFGRGPKTGAGEGGGAGCVAGALIGCDGGTLSVPLECRRSLRHRHAVALETAVDRRIFDLPCRAHERRAAAGDPGFQIRHTGVEIDRLDADRLQSRRPDRTREAEHGGVNGAERRGDQMSRQRSAVSGCRARSAAGS